MAMTDQAKEARKAYKREWARKNPDKVKSDYENKTGKAIGEYSFL